MLAGLGSHCPSPAQDPCPSPTPGSPKAFQCVLFPSITNVWQLAPALGGSFYHTRVSIRHLGTTAVTKYIQDHRIKEGFGLEGTLKLIQSFPCHVGPNPLQDHSKNSTKAFWSHLMKKAEFYYMVSVHYSSLL